MEIAAYTCLFLCSKNFEVEPLSLGDLCGYLLKDKYTKEQILVKENSIRKSTEYENETATLFEFVMFYVKIWKIAC